MVVPMTLDILMPFYGRSDHFRAAVESGRKIEVYADETRPFLQGARLTAWEMMKDGIPTTVIPKYAYTPSGCVAVDSAASRACRSPSSCPANGAVAR